MALGLTFFVDTGVIKMIAKKKRWGAIPASCKDYEYVAQAGKHYGYQWSIYAQKEESMNGWKKFRLMVSGSITGRANYNISWNSNQLRFAAGQDYDDLTMKRPALFSVFKKTLQELGYMKHSEGLSIADLTEERQEGKNWQNVNGFKFVGTVTKTDGVIWNIFYHPKLEGSEWENFNLCAEGVVEGRANYNLGWNGFRFATRKEIIALREHRPALFKRFCTRLKILGFIAKDYEPGIKI